MTIDVSEILDDPEFALVFAVQRANVSIDDHGRSVIAPVAPFTAVGSVQPEGGELVLTAEGTRVSRWILVVTTTRLQLATETTAADKVLWGGQLYTVRSIDDWSAYGVGFVEARAECVPLVGPNA